MSFVRAIVVVLCLVATAWTGRVLAAAPTVWLALGEQGGAYRDVAEAIRAELKRTGSGIDVVVAPWADFLNSSWSPPRAVVAIGVGALRGMAEAEPHVPLVATLVPRAAYQAAASTLPGRPLTGIWLDQPVGRQLDVLRLAMPGRMNLGVLLGGETHITESELQRAASERGFTLLVGRVEHAGQLPASLQRVLDEADILLALPDPQIYNGNTIQNVLTSAYRRRVPMAGFSPAYVKAGALLAVYSTPAQVGTQVGEMVRGILAGRALPPAQGPRDFTIAVNPDVARSLGIPIDAGAAEKWVEHIRAKERTP